MSKCDNICVFHVLVITVIQVTLIGRLGLWISYFFMRTNKAKAKLSKTAINRTRTKSCGIAPDMDGVCLIVQTKKDEIDTETNNFSNPIANRLNFASCAGF